MKVIKRKEWVVNSQPPPKGKHGPEAVINYLACYVTGTCIGDGRLINDEDGQVTIRIKDYAAGDKKLVTFTGAEFVRRFALHILPRTLGRARYAGIFAAAGRDGRLEKVRQLIAQQKGKLLPEDEADSQSEELQLAGEEDGSDTDVDGDSQYPPKCCNRCQSQLDQVGTLRGGETVQLMKLADAIDTRLEEQAPLFRLELLALLVSLFQCCWMVDQLPHAVRGVMMNRKLSYVESSALSALLERKLSEPVYPQDEDEELATTSGIPPPEKPEEASHAAA